MLSKGRGRVPRFALPLLAALVALLAAAPAAQATFHLIKVREVFPGTAARPNSGYVVLQMYSSLQNLVQNGNLDVYAANGTVTHSFTPSSSVPNSANQSTVLIADSEYAAQFPSGPTPDFSDSALNLGAAGGAVCWPQTEPPFDDCASWGNFSGQAMLASTDAAPAAPGGIPAGMAIRRSIAGGTCATQLEEADDTNNSSVDFAVVSPVPRSNATAPTEASCVTPVTTIDTKPASPTNATAAAFTFHANVAGASFECKLDSGAFAGCTSGVSYSGPLADGGHTFQVKATNASGTGGAATYGWTVDTAAPAATIDTHPLDPSPGGSAAFEFHASESATFACSLTLSGAPDAYAACLSGKTYSSLADGEYVFKVRATDQATNLGAPASFTWQVDNSLADTTPPQTTIVAKPPDPSTAADVAFSYSANEAGSSFECALDGAAFAACPVGGISYSGLANGPHSFQVRAKDSSGNLDPTPAGYSFSVAVPASPGGGGGSPGGGGTPNVDPGPAPAPRPATPKAPQTTITAKPAAKTRDRTPTFRFRADSAGASFECAVDKQAFKPCRSPYTMKPLKPGPHSLAVRARAGTATDSSPAKFGFKVLGKG
jgi:hypothetical protein